MSRLISHVLSTLALLAGTAATPALANDLLYEHAQAARTAAGQATFTIGTTEYQWLPQATVQREDTSAPQGALQARSSLSSTATEVAAQIGPYAIRLNDSAAPARAARSSATASTQSHAVVVNLRTAQPALLTNRLRLITDEAGQGQRLAQSLGATLLHDGSSSRLVLLGFDSPASALAALPAAAQQPGVTQASPDLIQQVRRPR